MKNKINKEIFFLWALSLTIFVDFLNGLFQGWHIGEAFRVILLFYCGCIILTGNKWEIGKLVLILSFLFINISISVLHDAAKETLRTDISMGLKTILFYMLSSSILILYKKGIFQKETINKIIRINLLYTPILFAFSNVVGKGKAGYTWYGESVGTKSEFLSLNSINSAMVLMYMYCVYNMFSARKKIWVLGAIYIAIPMLSLGTKTSIIVVISIPILFALLGITQKKIAKTIIVISLVLVIVLPIIWPFVMNKMSGILGRQLYLFQHRNLWSYLTSTRSNRVSIVWDYYIQHFSLLDIFPGSGYHYSHHIVSNLMGYSSDVIPIEMDWLDILTAYSIWGFFYTYIYALKPLLKYSSIKKDNDCKMYRWIIIVLIAYGTVAGHIFTEAISSTFLALGFCGYVMSANDTKLLKRRLGD